MGAIITTPIPVDTTANIPSENSWTTTIIPLNTSQLAQIGALNSIKTVENAYFMALQEYTLTELSIFFGTRMNIKKSTLSLIGNYVRITPDKVLKEILQEKLTANVPRATIVIFCKQELEKNFKNIVLADILTTK